MGAKIACVDIEETENNETVNLIKQEGGESFSYKCDVSNREQIKVMHARLTKDLGPVDILINNAGIVWGHLYVDPSKDQFIIDQINVNLMGQYWVSFHVIMCFDFERTVDVTLNNYVYYVLDILF